MNEPKTWRECPFTEGSKYIFTEEIKTPRYTFLKDEEVTYIRSSYSRYDNVTGYLFSSKTESKFLDIRDDEKIELYTDKIKKLKV